MLNNDVFKAAQNYKFDEIVTYKESGGNLNICNENGYSLLEEFLKAYYEYGDLPSDKEIALMDIYPNEFDDFWCSYIFKNQKKPLKERQSGIINQLDWFFGCGTDVNLCQFFEGMTMTPLAIAVREEDYFLTEYLLQHGADPKVWLFEEEKLESDYGFWLMEHIDVLLTEVRGERKANCIDIARLLAFYGLEDFNGICFGVDKETRTIDYGPFHYDY